MPTAAFSNVPRKRASLSRSASSASLRADMSRLKPTQEVMRSRSSRTGRPRLRMPGAVLAFDAVLPGPLGAGAHACMPCLQGRLQVLGRQPVQPSSWFHLVERLTDEGEECLAHKLHAAFGIAHPHAVTDGFAGSAIAGFALAQRRLGSLAFADVVGDQYGAGNPALDYQRRVGAGDLNRGAALAEEHVLVPDERLPGRVDSAERAFGRRIRTAIRVTVVNGVVQLPARQLLSRPAENPLRRRVHQGDAIFAVGDEDGVRRAVGYRGEQAELFGEPLLGALASGDVRAEGLKRKNVAGIVEKSVEV